MGWAWLIYGWKPPGAKPTAPTILILLFFKGTVGRSRPFEGQNTFSLFLSVDISSSRFSNSHQSIEICSGDDGQPNIYTIKVRVRRSKGNPQSSLCITRRKPHP